MKGRRVRRANYVVVAVCGGPVDGESSGDRCGRYIKFECVLHTLTHCCRCPLVVPPYLQGEGD